MKDAVLLELAARWEREAKTPDCEDATAEQWERASHALNADAEIDAMRLGA